MYPQKGQGCTPKKGNHQGAEKDIACEGTLLYPTNVAIAIALEIYFSRFADRHRFTDGSLTF